MSTFFSIIVDSTQDITKLDQSFLGFYTIDHHGAEDYTNLIINVLSQLGLDISKCRGQGYDGAKVMSGIYSGVQKRIQDIVPNAHFVHCCAHNLNLVICDSAKSSDTVRRFFITVQAVFNFFSSSAHRWALLALGDENTLKVHKTVLKKVCATRWKARHQAIFALKERFNDVLITLTKIALTTTNGDERNVSKSIRSKLDSVEFILLLCLWERVLRSMQDVSKVLQSVDINIQTSCDLLEQAIGSLSELRQNYSDIVNIANDLCSKWGISSKFPSKRQQFAKLHFDEIDGDRRLNVTEENFKIKIFYPVVDTALAQLKNRFKGLNVISSTFEFLNPTFLISTEENDLIKYAFDFIQLYKSDVTSDFTRQLLTSAERSFSKLKLIKNYLRNSTSQERLSNISVLSIERCRTDEINIKKIITDFANAKARKKMFF
ncbi:zinc finger MYM-type protein 1-like [Myzus persicae]|uniref:zinc finger MYM-type protein 1-like n=1 Tax=Myzus persicae TaxID=13164 RepID=UPI000B939FCD|nr:zinc finger MYM-type protein 1-like [Myzus persicae]